MNLQRTRVPFAIAGLALIAAWQAAVAQMEMGSMQGGSPPADARDPHSYSDGVDFTRGDERLRLADRERFGSLLIDNLEASRVDGETILPYDLEGWFGRTYDRVVLKAEGDIESGSVAEARTELLWGHAVAEAVPADPPSGMRP